MVEPVCGRDYGEEYLNRKHLVHSKEFKCIVFNNALSIFYDVPIAKRLHH